jgi:hypothetical protein
MCRISTTFVSYEGYNDMEANKSLSGHAYKKFFLKALQKGSQLRHKVLDSGDIVVWAASRNTSQ